MILYHNTSNDNAIKIAKEGIVCGLRAKVYGKGSEAEGAGIWCTTQRGYGYGGATITFEIDETDELLKKQNDTEYIVYRDIAPNEITDIDLVVSSISSVQGHTGTVESDIPNVINRFGKDKTLQVFKKNEGKFINPYNYDMFLNLVETGNKILKGNIKLTESDEWDFDDEPSYRELFEQYIEELKELLPDLVISNIIESKNGMLRANIKYKDRKTVLSYVGEYEGASVGDKYQSYTNDVEGVANFLKKNFMLESKNIFKEDLQDNINDKKSIIEEINKIVDTCKKYSITKELRKYTVPIMRDYQLRYNPTADSRRAPWIFLIDEINSTNNEIDTTLEDFIDSFIREGNQCIKDNKLEESNDIKYPNKIYHFTDIDSTKSILKCNKLNANDYNLICCTDIENFRNFKTNANVVRFTIYTDRLPNDAMVKKDNPIKGHNVKSESEWVIDLTNCSNKYLDITDTDLIQIEYSPELQKDNIISNTLRKKLEEASRNELLAKSKAETITRYNKSSGYKGFSLVDIDTTAIKTRNSIVITNRVGNYFDSVELDDILYWVGLEVTEARDNKMTQKVVEKALLGAMDGMDIKVDCNCGDFCLEENTLIKLLNGNVVTVKQLKDMFDNKDELWLYSTDSNGDFRPGKVENVWVSGKSDKMVKVTLDNGREIITTPNHKYMMRDGSYKEAQYLSEYDSLMPLYFSYHNGYENVKLNSKKATQFHSVYKIVADTLLSKEKELAKERSGEDTIQIHHKDFNKLNNYPSNLEPKGKLEHWYYHASLAGKNIDKLIKSGRDFWENDPRRFEALEKQKGMASKCKKEWWASMTKDERHRWALENNWACQPENSKSISDNAKDIWRKYTENEKNHRLRTNPFIVNNPMKDEVFKNSDKFIQRNKDISNSLQRFHDNTTQEQRSELYGWAKGKKFSDSHRSKISKALKEKSNETQRKGIITRCRKTINRIIENNLPINEENFEIYKGKYDPSYLRVFDNFNDMLNKLDIPTNYNHKVIGVELITYDNPIEVYDIEVKDYHNFYVDAGVMLHNCYRFAYMATQFEYKYGKPENRPSNITNPDGYGAMCKHLIALLSNKSWISQVASTLQQWIIDEIDWVRDFLKMSEEEFKLPDEYARYLGKHGAMKKFWDKQPDEEQDTDVDETNEDSDSDNENDEPINDNPDTDNVDTDVGENEDN